MRYVFLLVDAILLIGAFQMAIGIETKFNDDISREKFPDTEQTPRGLLIAGLICVAISGSLFMWKSKYGSTSFYDNLDKDYPDRDTRGPDNMDGGGDG